MTYDINPLDSLKMSDIELFETVLNPSKISSKRDKWTAEYVEVFNRYLCTGLNMPMQMKKCFTILLMLYPMKEKELLIFFRLDSNQKVGYLSKYMIKKAYGCRVSTEIIDMYNKCKDGYFSTKGDSSYKVLLTRHTYRVMFAIIDKNTRESKLDYLLDS